MVAVFVGLIASLAHAEPVVTLPLDGYYRPGKFFPVRVEADREVTVEVTADAVSSRGRGRSLVLPAMSVSRVAGTVRVTVDGQTKDLPIRPLEPGQKLTLMVGRPWPRGPDTSLRVAMPDGRLQQLTQAYESADVVLARESDTADITDPVVALLNACGVRVSTLIDDEPDSTRILTSPRDGTFPRGPLSSLDSGGAYDAAVGFQPERSARTRQMVWLATAMFAIFAMALLLPRLPHLVGWVIALSVIWSIVSAIVFARAPAVSHHRGWIMQTRGTQPVYTNCWSFRTALTPVEDAFTAATESAARPLFGGNHELLKMWIEPDRGDWRYHYTLTPQTKAIFVFHGDGNGPLRATPAERSETPIMREIARRYYQRPGDTVEVNFGRDRDTPLGEIVTLKLKE